MAEQQNSRFPLIDPSHASGPVSDAFRLLPDLNIFRAMASAESLFPPYMAYLEKLFKPMDLKAPQERMVVLLVARYAECVYVWRQNAIVAKSIGVTEEQISALERYELLAQCFSEADKAALQFADEALRSIEVTEKTYTEAAKYFTPRALLELLYVLGTYMFVVRVVRNGRVPLDCQPAESPV